MYDVGGKLLSGIKSMYVDRLACVLVKGDESEQFRIDSGVTQRYIMSPWILNAYMDAVMKEVKMGMGRREVKFLEGGREWRLPGFLYEYGLVLCGKSGEDLNAIVGRFVEVCRRRGLKVNDGTEWGMVLNGEEGLECKLYVDGIRLEDVSNLNSWDVF